MQQRFSFWIWDIGQKVKIMAESKEVRHNKNLVGLVGDSLGVPFAVLLYSCTVLYSTVLYCTVLYCIVPWQPSKLRRSVFYMFLQTIVPCPLLHLQSARDYLSKSVSGFISPE